MGWIYRGDGETYQRQQLPLGYQNVEFIPRRYRRYALAGKIPLDVIISNCVLNLVPDKENFGGYLPRCWKLAALCHFRYRNTGQDSPLSGKWRNLRRLCVRRLASGRIILDIVRKTGFENIGLTKDLYPASDELLLEYISPEVRKNFRQSGA